MKTFAAALIALCAVLICHAAEGQDNADRCADMDPSARNVTRVCFPLVEGYGLTTTFDTGAFRISRGYANESYEHLRWFGAVYFSDDARILKIEVWTKSRTPMRAENKLNGSETWTFITAELLTEEHNGAWPMGRNDPYNVLKRLQTPLRLDIEDCAYQYDRDGTQLGGVYEAHVMIGRLVRRYLRDGRAPSPCTELPPTS